MLVENATADGAKDELWAIYAWWSSVLVLKMMLLSWYTGRIRVKNQVIHSEEDRMWMKGPDVILSVTGDGHPDVFRIRSAHRKDIETVLPYLAFVPIWLNVETCSSTVKILLPGFAISSILNTLLHMQLLRMSVFFRLFISITLYCIITYVCAISVVRYVSVSWL